MSVILKSLLSQANTALRNTDYAEAMILYEMAMENCTELIKKIVKFNIELINKRINNYKFDHIVCNLIPINQIKIKSNTDCLFSSLGSDPFFYIDCNYETLNTRFYLCEFEIQTKNPDCIATLYPDYGEDFSENTAIKIKYISSEIKKEVIKFNNDLKLLRFDPFSSSSDFNIKSFNIKPLDEKQAFNIMFSHIMKECSVKQKILKNDFSVAEMYDYYISVINADSKEISYSDWINKVETPSLPSYEVIQNFLANLNFLPLISILMPVYNTDEVYLRACIESVINQSYPKWELCIADDKSPKQHVRQLLQEYYEKDSRIKVVFREKNGHISRASNSALEITTGDFVALLDHDDALPIHALYFMAQAIEANPDVQILYSDEDKIDTQGSRFEPHFKSDWNPDLFFSQNYVCHLGVYRHKLLKRIGGFRVGVEGSQDQDLLLRCLPHVNSDQIIHIHRILYHWRTVEGSTALGCGEKSYTSEAGIKALRDFFAEHEEKSVDIELGLVPNTYRVKWPIPEPAPLVSLLIPTRDRKELTEKAVRSILEKTTYTNFEIIIINNESIEAETLCWFEEIQAHDKRVRVIPYPHPFNYSAINNFGVGQARGSLIGLINNDVEVISPEWLTEMVSHASRPEIGCVGAKLYYSNDTVQHAGVILGVGGVANHYHLKFDRWHPGYFSRLISIQNLSAVTAACLVVKKSIFDAVRGLDETNLKVAFNDVDFCLKVREAGYRNLWTPYAELYHYESISRGEDDTPEKQERFKREVQFMQKKWDNTLNNDPYYNPNLSKSRMDFSLNVKN